MVRRCLLVAVGLAAGVEGLRSFMKKKSTMRDEVPDFGFMGAGEEMPAICGAKQITPEQVTYIADFFKALGHAGVRKQAGVIFANQFACWYGKMLSDGCGGLKPKREGTTARRAMQTMCRDSKIGFDKVFSDPSVSEEERMYITQTFPKQKDFEGVKVEGSYSQVMDTVYTIAGKEAMCLMLEFVDDGCTFNGPFKEY